MPNDEVNKILSMSPKNQEAWLKKQEWYDEETFFDDSEFFGVIHLDYSDELEEVFKFPDQYVVTGRLVSDGYISRERLDEIEGGLKLSKEEKGYLKECIKNQALEDEKPYSILKKEIKLNENKLLLFITSQGNPLLGYSKEFEGFFKDDEDAMKFFSKYKDVEFC